MNQVSPDSVIVKYVINHPRDEITQEIIRRGHAIEMCQGHTCISVNIDACKEDDFLESDDTFQNHSHILPENFAKMPPRKCAQVQKEGERQVSDTAAGREDITSPKSKASLHGDQEEDGVVEDKKEDTGVLEEGFKEQKLVSVDVMTQEGGLDTGWMKRIQGERSQSSREQ